MNNRAGRCLAVFPALVALACGSHSQETAGSGSRSSDPGGFPSAHWTCVRRVEAGPAGRHAPAEFEVWMKSDRALIGATVGGGDRIRVLRLGPDAYSWKEGETKGLRFEAPSSDERHLFVPSVDWIRKAAPCREGGRKSTSGTMNGHPFVRYDCEEKSDGTKRVYYFATDLQEFPIHATITYPDHTIVIYDAKSIELPASFPDSMLEVPAGMQFEKGPV